MVRKYQKRKVCKESIQWDDFHNEKLVPLEIAAEFLGMSVPFDPPLIHVSGGSRAFLDCYKQQMNFASAVRGRWIMLCL